MASNEELFGSDDEGDTTQQQTQQADPAPTPAATQPMDDSQAVKTQSLDEELFGDADDDDEAAAARVTKVEASPDAPSTTAIDALFEEGQEDDELAQETRKQLAEELKQRKREEEKERALKQEDESEDEEDQLKQKEKEQRRIAAAKVKAEGDPLTVQTTVRPTFDNDASLLLVRLPNVVGINPKPFDPATHLLEDSFEEKVAARSTAPSALTKVMSGGAPAAAGTKVKQEKGVKKEPKAAKKGKDAMDVDDEAEEDADEDEDAEAGGDAGEKKDGIVPLNMAEAEEVHDKRVKLNVENIIRWRLRKDESTGAMVKESNARLVKFSDGSQFLYLGNEVFQVSIDPRDRSKNYCLQNLNRSLNPNPGAGGTKKAVGKFDGLMKFRVLGIHSSTHQKLKQAIQLAHVQKPKIQRRYDMIASKDMEATTQAISQLEKDDEARRRKRERLNERERAKRGDRGDRDREREREKKARGGLTADYLEDDDDEEEEASFTRSSSSSAHHAKRKRFGDSEDEDEEEGKKRLEKAKSSYDDDDDEEDEAMDEEEEEEEDSKKKKKKSKGVKEEGAAEPAAADEEVVIKKSKSKRRKLESDGEDEDDDE